MRSFFQGSLIFLSLLLLHEAYQAECSEIAQIQKQSGLIESFTSDHVPASAITVYKVKKGDHLSGIAHKFKTNITLIKKINGLKNDVVYEGMKLKVVDAVFSVNIDKSENRLKLYMDQKILKEYSVATGAKNKTPTGRFKIISKVKNPDWYWDGKIIPAESPKNQLGTRWLGFDKTGYGIHGTIQPKTIGTPASLGCIRMRNKDVEELYLFLPLGTSVTIVD